MASLTWTYFDPDPASLQWDKSTAGCHTSSSWGGDYDADDDDDDDDDDAADDDDDDDGE